MVYQILLQCWILFADVLLNFAPIFLNDIGNSFLIIISFTYLFIKKNLNTFKYIIKQWVYLAFDGLEEFPCETIRTWCFLMKQPLYNHLYFFDGTVCLTFFFITKSISLGNSSTQVFKFICIDVSKTVSNDFLRFFCFNSYFCQFLF